MMSGDGQLTIKKKDRMIYQYIGNFIANKKDRYGEITYSEGKSYKGYFKNDQRHGNGTLVTDSQTKYTGEWELGKMHGQGTLTSKDGIKKGIWQMGKFIGATY